MANTSSRTLRLLSLLQTHRYWPGPELADRLGVSVRTLRRDVDRLRELGYPVDANRGVDGGYQLAAGAALPPLVIDDEEAVAVAIGLRVATQGAIAGIEESSVRALTKIIQVMPPRLRRRVDTLRTVTVPAAWTGGPTVDAEILTTLAQACRDEEQLRFSYTAHGGVRSERQVEPHRLVSLGRRWYLVAYDLTRHDWRSFRLDRVAEPRSTATRFRPRELPAEDAAAFVRAGIDNRAVATTVEVLVHAPAEDVRAKVGQWATVEEAGKESGGEIGEENGGGRCRLLMTVDSLEWVLMTVGVVGAEFEVVSPPELTERVREWSARFGRAAAAGEGARTSAAAGAAPVPTAPTAPTAEVTG
ncbi:helix-turn-helix transcriptional regulator [Actinopolymorpha rutila]|uniref:Putative DNA-binding transcriptional regulator YafY n=1 Tax=Actinopolymorpha rutila TaxID=446787 RepID=A0A852ZCK5_9ACTN|nr:YafY family protein [Actinopolymorpha rutila]NYH90644.1 putative DNA-binding transcriptional regulator YafY [Actinopolymorpha rutila]